jgi:hypothetical protein
MTFFVAFIHYLRLIVLSNNLNIIDTNQKIHYWN